MYYFCIQNRDKLRSNDLSRNLYYTFQVNYQEEDMVSPQAIWGYWCRQCQKWIPKSKAKTWKNKRLACPYCNRQLRVKARH